MPDSVALASAEAVTPVALMDPLPMDSPIWAISPQVKAKYSMEQLERAITNVQFQCAYVICGHTWLDKDGALKICSNEAGAGTVHPGKGRCAAHDDAVNSPLSPYVRQLREYGSLQAIFAEFSSRTSQVKRLDEELSIARTVLAGQLNLLKTDKRSSNQEIYRDIINCLEATRRIAESMAKIEQIQSQGITLESITAFLWSLQAILDEEILDQAKKTRIFERIATECQFVQRTADCG